MDKDQIRVLKYIFLHEKVDELRVNNSLWQPFVEGDIQKLCDQGYILRKDNYILGLTKQGLGFIGELIKEEIKNKGE